MSTHIYDNQYEAGAIQAGLAARAASLTYALLAYAAGAGALFWLFFAAADFVPYAVSEYRAATVPGALLINTGLVLAFALQHTVMARRSFKEKWTRIVPRHLERATFVLASGIFLAALLWFWQPLPGAVWSVDTPAARMAVQGLAMAGVAYVLLSSLVTNHFELFGLRQAWLHATGRPYTPLEFKQRWMYRYSRHPMMLGLLVVFWAAPEMTATRLVLAILLTLYTFTGIRFEERGLIEEFGDKYRQYRRDIGLFFTLR